MRFRTPAFVLLSLSTLCGAAPALDRPAGTRVELAGPVREQMDRVVEHWLLTAPDKNPAMLGMLADRDRAPRGDLLPWSGEFAGKYLTAATEVLRATGDERLRAKLTEFVGRLIALQDANGYLGPFAKQYQLTGRGPNYKDGGTWDAWGHYHAMVGLLLWHEASGDAKALAAAAKIGDLLCETFGKPGKTVLSIGNSEMNQAVAHSLALLHRATGDKKYLDMAEKVVAEFALNGAGDYLRAALAGKEFFQTPKPRWESLHAIMALAELHQATGNPDYRKAFESLWWSIAKLDRHNNGGFSSGEQAQGNPYHRGAIETCCTIAWVAMTVDVLRTTGDPVVADELELSTLNQVVALHAPSGEYCTYNTPMDGLRVASTTDIAFQIRPGSEQLNCCSVNAARGFGMIADWALLADRDGLVVNWYGPGVLSAPVGGATVKLTQETRYPADGRVIVRVDPGRPAKFAIKFRIPHWSATTRATVNGVAVEATAGKYLSVDRTWQAGDRVELEFDLSPRFWVGERESAGRTSIYRGPLLLALESPADRSKFSDGWKPYGQVRATRGRGETVEARFTGDTATWRGFRFDDGGKARVTVDGKDPEVVDQYGPGRELPFSWRRSNLGPGEHTLRIEALGERSAASKDVWVNVTGFGLSLDESTVFDAKSLKIEPVGGAAGEALSFTAKDVDGRAVALKTFGAAGWSGTPYVTWLQVRGATPTAFSPSNPSRTAHASR